MTEIDLQAIEARANAATPGPWVNQDGYRIRIGDRDGPVLVDGKEFEATHADLDFIAQARADIPALIARVKELEAEIERRQNSDWERSELD